MSTNPTAKVSSRRIMILPQRSELGTLLPTKVEKQGFRGRFHALILPLPHSGPQLRTRKTVLGVAHATEGVNGNQSGSKTIYRHKFDKQSCGELVREV